MSRARFHKRFFDNPVWSSPRGHIVPKRKFETDEVLKHCRDALAPGFDVQLPQIYAIDFDGPALWIVKAAQQLCECSLARAVLPYDRQRRSGRNREIEIVEHLLAALRVGERHLPEANLSSRHSSRRLWP